MATEQISPHNLHFAKVAQLTEQIEEIRDLLENAPLDFISARTLYEVIMDVIEKNKPIIL